MHLPCYLRELVTEPDNKTFCPLRIVALAGTVQFFVLTAANYVQHAQFDPQSWALGFGGLVAGVGAGLKMKKDTPPAAAEEDK
jgi:hypothetical protein